MNDVITQNHIEKDLCTLGLQNGDIVAVHSSMKRIGAQVEKGPQAVIQALLNVIGTRGTLLMPVFNGPGTAIDLNSMPSRLGLITETFRTWPHVLRSNDPTHSIAAIGRQAIDIIGGHEDVPPLGKQCPLHKAALLGGKTLHLGTDLKSCSLIHVAESIAGAPYLHIGYREYLADHTYIGTDRITRTKKLSEAPGDSSGFMKIHDHPSLIAARHSGKIGHADSEIYDSKKLLDAAVAIISDDPFLILCDRKECTVCSERKLVRV